ncbi:hypothetical protein ABPG74_009260 [Tetrahymena malaccensis]
MLAQYFKNNNFYNQESLQSHFGISKTLEDDKSQEQPISKFKFFNQTAVKKNQDKLNSLSSLRQKWSYYTRASNQSPLMKDNLQKSPNNKDLEYSNEILQLKYSLQRSPTIGNKEYTNEIFQTEKLETLNSKDEIQFTNL